MDECYLQDAVSDAPVPAVTMVDPETLELVVMSSVSPGTAVVSGPLRHAVFLVDENGDRAKFVDGHLLTVAAGGLPQHGYQASTIADAWQTIMTTSKEMHFAQMIVQTKDAIISFDGGNTEHYYLTAAANSGPIPGLKIPAGSVIKARNAVAGQNWTLLHIFLW